jgi:hypothetical protein
MINENGQPVNTVLQEKLMEAMEATMKKTTEIPVVDGNKQEFNFSETQDNVQDPEPIADETQPSGMNWDEWVNGYLYFLDQQRQFTENQLMAKDEIIEKLVVDLGNQEQKIASLIDEFATMVHDLTKAIEQVASLSANKHSNTAKQYRFEDIPGYKNINPEIFRKECSHQKNTVSVLPFKDNVALMRTVFLIENQSKLTPDERTELKRLMLDF